MFKQMIKKGIITVMKNHTYKWNNSYRLQSSGGGIGDKLAQAAARLFMIWWDHQFLNLVRMANINVTMYKRFVDDSNLKAVAIDLNLGWDSHERRLVPIEVSNTAPDEHTANIVQQIANSVTSMLTFTSDFPSKHANGKMPVLDISMWTTETEEGTISNYEFYSKPMVNNISIPAGSAVSHSVKLSTYRQMAFRVLRNTAIHLPWCVKARHLNELSFKMMLGGYSEGFRVRAIEGGIKGFLNLLYQCEKDDRPVNQSRDLNLSRKKKRSAQHDWFAKGEAMYDSVLFVPATHKSQLAKDIRDIEAANRQGRKTRIKIVELTGRTVRNTIAKNYPWRFEGCGSDQCFHCTTNENPTISCRTPGVGYTITCTVCGSGGLLAQYQGESGKNMFSRGKDHLREFKGRVTSNCMVIHSNKHHNGSRELTYVMKPTSTFKTPLDRQLDESMRLKFSSASIIMNSGSEWRGESIPRASFGPILPTLVEEVSGR